LRFALGLVPLLASLASVSTLLQWWEPVTKDSIWVTDHFAADQQPNRGPGRVSLPCSFLLQVYTSDNGFQ
jgi:hypothetical protein